MANCVLCGRRDAGVAYACSACARPVQIALEGLARLAPELDVTISRQGRTGDGGRGGDDEPLPVNLGASMDAWAVVNTVSTWARHVETMRGHGYGRLGGERDHQALAAVAAWLATQVEWLRHQPEAEQALDELADACAVAVRIVDRRAPRWYAGPCRVPLLVDGQPVVCPQDLYAHPGATTVRCGACGAQHDAAARRDWLLDAARDTLAHAEMVGRALAALGLDVDPARVRVWAARGHIVAHGHEQAGRRTRPLYRVGDVEDVARRMAARRVVA